MLRRVAVVLLLLFSVGFSPPPLDGAVTDTSGTLTAEDDRALEARIATYRADGERDRRLPRRLSRRTLDRGPRLRHLQRVGRRQEGKDNGVLVVIAPAEHRARIETGKGIGGSLTDLQCGRIVRERIIPLFKAGRHREAIEAALDAFEAALDERPEPPFPTLDAKAMNAAAPSGYWQDPFGLIAPEVLVQENERASQDPRWKKLAVVVLPTRNQMWTAVATKARDQHGGSPQWFSSACKISRSSSRTA